MKIVIEKLCFLKISDWKLH